MRNAATAPAPTCASRSATLESRMRGKLARPVRGRADGKGLHPQHLAGGLSYWWPVFTILEEGGHAVVLVNPQHVKAVPGRKTDVADSEWLADLLRHGLLRASFIPPAADPRAARGAPLPQDAGAGARAGGQPAAEGAGERQPEAGGRGHRRPGGQRPADAGGDRPRRGRPRGAGRAGQGPAAGEAAGAAAGAGGAGQAPPPGAAPGHPGARGLPGGGPRGPGRGGGARAGPVRRRSWPCWRRSPAWAGRRPPSLLAELGADMGVFASAKHLASWAGVCPGNRQSGGRRLSGKTTHGNVWLRGVLGEIAWAADPHPGHLVRGPLPAAGAAPGQAEGARGRDAQRAHGHLRRPARPRRPTASWGPTTSRRQDPQRAARRHVAQLERLGYRVALTPVEAA